MTSQKKHVSQMSNEERTILLQQVKRIKNWKKTRHLFRQMSCRKISMTQVYETIHHSELIEYHLRNDSKRVLLRGTIPYNKHVVCAVFDLDVKSIITAYWNQKDDFHKTLDKSRYDEKINIMKEFTWDKNRII